VTNWATLACVALCFAAASAQIIIQKPCQEVSIKQNFNLQAVISLIFSRERWNIVQNLVFRALVRVQKILHLLPTERQVRVGHLHRQQKRNHPSAKLLGQIRVSFFLICVDAQKLIWFESSTKAVDIIVGSARPNPASSTGEGKLLVNFPSIGPGGPGTKHK
jgi:hypothetical protein